MTNDTQPGIALDLLPCPFCGGSKVKQVDGNGYYVTCENCYAYGPHENLNPYSMYQECMQRAVGRDLWNARPREEAMRELAENIDIDAFLIRLGMPHVRTCFPGDGNPTVEQVALEIGKALIQIHLGLAKEMRLEDIDGDIEPRNINDLTGEPQ